MAETFPVVRPHPLTNRLNPADFGRGAYDDSLEGDARYDILDLVTIRSGAVARSVAATAAAAELLAIAGQSWSMPKAFAYLYAKGVPLNRIDRRDEWVFTLAGEFNSTLQGIVAEGKQCDLIWDADAAAKALTVRNATASPTVKLLRVFEGEPGDTNVRVVVNFLEAKLW